MTIPEELPMTFIRLLIAASLAVCFLPGEPASAQPWPAAKPITVVVPFPPGPGLDLVARLTATKIGGALGQSAVVENRTGANGTIGANMVARATPDGYTIVLATAGTHV